MAATTLTKEQREQLLTIARTAIQQGLEGNPWHPADAAGVLADKGACFVTLKKQGQLRGCIGSLEAHRPLQEDIAHNAYAAAFRDPRFPPLRPDEWPEIELHLSVLQPASPLTFASEAELLNQLTPRQDGLIIEFAGRRATFLPSVWEQLPEPLIFLQHLKQKAGLSADFWHPELKAWRYHVEEWGENPSLENGSGDPNRD